MDVALRKSDRNTNQTQKSQESDCKIIKKIHTSGEKDKEETQQQKRKREDEHLSINRESESESMCEECTVNKPIRKCDKCRKNYCLKCAEVEPITINLEKINKEKNTTLALEWQCKTCKQKKECKSCKSNKTKEKEYLIEIESMEKKIKELNEEKDKTIVNKDEEI